MTQLIGAFILVCLQTALPQSTTSKATASKSEQEAVRGGKVTTADMKADDKAVISSAVAAGYADRLGSTVTQRTDAAKAAVVVIRSKRGSSATITVKDVRETLDSMGRVQVKSTPTDAEVTIDGISWPRHTNADVYALQGDRRIRVSKTGSGVVHVTCTVTKNSNLVVTADLATGTGDCK